ncbi:hypothetical protein LX32DRAFT_379649 [Colletotrichum zoysiae]|uniref:Uncharacterized protein n=1 Tax=Colletotrichum zoysiae TaxID=1216348 RepID=A0AAD9HGV1_9PEZI|nr:hypothetical protein LX32DRAFT_379649 [Colletotrichum zoysiae]
MSFRGKSRFRGLEQSRPKETNDSERRFRETQQVYMRDAMWRYDVEDGQVGAQRKQGGPTTLKQRLLENWRRGERVSQEQTTRAKIQMNGSSSADGKKGKGRKGKKTKEKKNPNQIQCPTFHLQARGCAALHWTGNSSHAPQFPAGRRGPQESGRGPGRTLWCFSMPIAAPLLTKEAHAIPGQKGGCRPRLSGISTTSVVSWMDCEVGSGNSRPSYPDLAFVHYRQAGELRRNQLRRHASAYHIRIKCQRRARDASKMAEERMMHCDNGR